MLRIFPQLCSMVCVHESNDIEVLDQAGLDQLVSASMREAVRADVAEADTALTSGRPKSAQKPQMRGRRPILRILRALWDPFHSRALMSTVMDPQGVEQADESCQAAVLAEYWADTFADRPFSKALASAITTSRAKELDYGRMPTARDFAAVQGSP